MSTGVVRLSYAHIWAPSRIDEESKEKYSTAILIDKADKSTVDKINAAIEHLEKEAKEKNKGKLPKNFKRPLRDGDEEKPEDENYAGKYFLNASSSRKPGIVKRVNGKLETITEEGEVYSGAYVRVGLNFYLFDVKGNVGIAAGLNNILKVKDGEPLAGGTSASQDFDDDFDYSEIDADAENDSFLN